VAALLDFKSPFTNGGAFYSGGSITPLVPFVFPVAINGRSYIVDSKSGEFTRQYDDRVRDSVDQSSEPGEASINSQGLWRRSQSSWHYGAGQKHSDTADAEPYRFNTSKGINVWTNGNLSLLKDTTRVLSDAAATLQSIVAGTTPQRLYVASGNNVVFYPTLSGSSTPVTLMPTGNVGSMATDGYNVWVSFAGSGIYMTNTSSTVFGAYITGTDTFNKIKYAKGRLMGAVDNKMYNFITGGTPASGLLFTHPNTGWRWVGFAGGQNHIYAAGYAGQTSLIYKPTIKTDATALDAPTVAAELPEGEVVTALDSYLGYVLIGTTTGFRFASSDTNGNLVVGPLIEVGQVDAFASQGQFVWFSYKNLDATSTGIGRMNISTQISTNQPAWASDLMVTAQGAVPSISMYGTRPVFTVTGSGVYCEHATNLVASGSLETGLYRWGVIDQKLVPKWDMHTEALAGTVVLSANPNLEGYTTIGTASVAGESNFSFNGSESYLYDVEVKLTLTRAANNISGPSVNHWMGRAYVAPLRSEIFSVPVLLHKQLSVRGIDYFFDVEAELAALRALVSDPSVIVYQDGVNTYSVIVENLQWKPMDSSQIATGWSWDGTCVVIMRSIR
jgi:hypothetical protein